MLKQSRSFHFFNFIGCCFVMSLLPINARTNENISKRLSPLWDKTGIRAGAVAVGVGDGIVTRVNMIEMQEADFITAGRARGIPENKLHYRHALRNTFIPILTLIGLQFAILLAGAVLTETTFSWPGMGRYLVTRIQLRDYNAVQATIGVFALFVAIISVVMDILYAFIDPRIRY